MRRILCALVLVACGCGSNQNAANQKGIGAECTTDDNQTNYCFLVCGTKTDCNLHRSLDSESDCTSSLAFIDGALSRKVCRPPNSGTPTDAGAG